MAIDTNQVLTLSLANLPTFTLVLLGILYNNARLNDLRDLLRAESRAEIQMVRSEMQDIRHLIEKTHSDLLPILPDHEHRINRLEDKR